jgi:hypothetical protein
MYLDKQRNRNFVLESDCFGIGQIITKIRYMGEDYETDNRKNRRIERDSC